jgi:hypothetical protein
MGVLAALYAGAIAALAFALLPLAPIQGDGCKTVQGGNLYAAIYLVFVGSVIEMVLIVVARHWRRLLAAVLLLGGIGLSVAIGLVALDSATVIVTCVYPPDSGQATYLYYLWGLSACIFFVQAARVLSSERHSRSAR